MCRVTTLFSLLILFLGVSSSLVQAKYWVSTYQGAGADYKIMRGDKVLQPAILMGLVEGDTIIVPPKGALSVYEDGKPIITITAQKSPFLVPAGKAPSLLDNILLQIKTIFQPAKEKHSQMVSRGGGVFIISSSKKNWLYQLPKPLYLTWRKEGAPYTVEITDHSGNTLFQQKKIKTNQISLTPPLTLKKFMIRISASPAGKAKVDGKISVRIVDQKKLPKGIKDILKHPLPENIKKRALVGMLSQYPRWHFQAYQLAKAYGFKNAVTAMEQGRHAQRR